MNAETLGVVDLISNWKINEDTVLACSTYIAATSCEIWYEGVYPVEQKERDEEKDGDSGENEQERHSWPQESQLLGRIIAARNEGVLDPDALTTALALFEVVGFVGRPLEDSTSLSMFFAI